MTATSTPSPRRVRPPCTTGSPAAQPPPPPRRDAYLDLLRAGSLLVVVLWHWVFTVLWWADDGPHASNPIGHTPGLWALTWLFQVMPVFFFVGGYVHHRTWQRVAGPGATGRFLRQRLTRLAVPTLALLAAVAAVRVMALAVLPEAGGLDRGLVLLVSPLWFLGVYLLLVVATPLAERLHRRWGPGALSGFVAGVALVELLRFHLGVPYVEWVNFLLVYGFAHQLGFWWDELAAGGRRVGRALALAGVLGLAALTTWGPYPRSMVGVPGEPISNMAPPSACIVALACLQVGLVLLARPRTATWLAAGAADRGLAWANRNAMTVFLWHFTGYAVFVGVLHLAGVTTPEEPTAAWWVQRPLWLAGPALCTVPLVRLFRRLERA